MDKLMSDEAEGRLNLVINEVRQFLEATIKEKSDLQEAQLRQELDAIKADIASLQSSSTAARNETSALKDKVIETLSAVVVANPAANKGA